MFYKTLEMGTSYQHHRTPESKNYPNRWESVCQNYIMSPEGETLTNIDVANLASELGIPLPVERNERDMLIIHMIHYIN